MMMMMMVKSLMVMDGVGCVDNTLLCSVGWLWTMENDYDGDGGYDGGVQCPRKREKIKLLQKRFLAALLLTFSYATTVQLCHMMLERKSEIGFLRRQLTGNCLERPRNCFCAVAIISELVSTAIWKKSLYMKQCGPLESKTSQSQHICDFQNSYLAKNPIFISVDDLSFNEEQCGQFVIQCMALWIIYINNYAKARR